MKPDHPALPEFRKPPLIEVALSVQFKPLQDFRNVHIGMLYQEFAQRGYPVVEELPPIANVLERLGTAEESEQSSAQEPMRIELLTTPPLLRHWFGNEAGTELVQVQRDRFAHNWKQIGDGSPYPRYSQIRQRFGQQFKTFTEFLHAVGISQPEPTQCEVTYVNHIPVGGPFESVGRFDQVLAVWCPPAVGTPAPEDGQIAFRYLIPVDGKPVGRLYVQANAGRRDADGKPVLILTLTARGYPLEKGLEGALRFLDVGHEWVVRGFAAVTTKQMHTAWERVT